MARFNMFQRPVSRAVHKTRMLHLLRCITANDLRGTQIHKHQQINLVRNRLDASWHHPRIRALVTRYGTGS